MIEILKGYDSGMEYNDDNENGNKLDAQTKNNNIVLICLKPKTYNYQFVSIDTFQVK